MKFQVFMEVKIQIVVVWVLPPRSLVCGWHFFFEWTCDLENNSNLNCLNILP